MLHQAIAAPESDAAAEVAPAADGLCIWFRASRVLPRTLLVSVRAGVVHVSTYTARRTAPISHAAADHRHCALVKLGGKFALIVFTASFFLSHREAERISKELNLSVEVRDGTT